MKKNKYLNNNKEISEGNEIKKAIKIIGGVLIVFLVVYFLGGIITGNITLPNSSRSLKDGKISKSMKSKNKYNASIVTQNGYIYNVLREQVFPFFRFFT